MSMIRDEEFCKHVQRYAADEDTFFNDFAKAFGKFLALGVPAAAIEIRCHGHKVIMMCTHVW